MQLPLLLDHRPLHPTVRSAVSRLSEAGTREERGAVFTAPEVVSSLLDLAGYTADRALHELRLLEPAAGGGDFLLPALDRLLDSYLGGGGSIEDVDVALAGAVLAVELHEATWKRLVDEVILLLEARGLPEPAASALASRWIRRDDFLLTAVEGAFDVVVGNPPYVRQERIPEPLLREYRRRFTTLYDRADLYVLFYERCLGLLAPEGRLAFICANRWLKNKYGGPLRELVASGFHLEHVIDLEHLQAFDKEVIAYPAITVIRRSRGDTTRVARPNGAGLADLPRLVDQMLSGDAAPAGGSVAVMAGVASGRDPWLLDAPGVLAALRRQEGSLPVLEEDGCRITIGVATGCDRVFIDDFEALPVEPARKLPLLMAPDIRDGAIRWSGKGIVNPFLSDGQLAELGDHPAFRAYILKHEEALRARHVASKNPTRWYRTIDRIYEELTTTPKLLIPDIKGDATVVYDEGRFYPHHNLYVITSTSWDLRALQAVLRSSMALAFVAAYCVRMAGGFLRFQAQYLRRIRIPSWASLSDAQRQELVSLRESRDQARLDAAVLPLYGLSPAEASAIRAFASANRARPTP